MTSAARYFVRLGVLLLVVRVLTDIATPHAPGAYRVAPGASVEATRAPYQTMAVAVPVPAPPSRLEGLVGTRRMAEPRVETRSAPSARIFLPRVFHPSESAGSRPAPDDD